MNKIIAFILIVTVLPSFTANAWVGGPFSNNSHTPAGDDGVYEAIAIPSFGNGVGMYRWAVNNRNAGGTTLVGQQGNNGNVQFGGQVGSFNQHVWYFQGSTYFGPCFGSVNSGAGGIVTCTGSGGTADPAFTSTGSQGNPQVGVINPNLGPVVGGVATTIGDFANSSFIAYMNKSGRFIASRNFFGSGELRVGLFNPNATPSGVDANGNPTFGASVVPFTVFGTRVSVNVTDS